MRSWRTTVCGALAALTLAGFGGLSLPEPWPRVLVLVCSVALGALGYHATDCERCPGNAARKAALGVVVVCCALLAGCVVSQFRLSLTLPGLGTLSTCIGGGALGNRAVTNALAQTNAPGAILGATNGPAAEHLGK